jgi:hypothetical protein
MPMMFARGGVAILFVILTTACGASSTASPSSTTTTTTPIVDPSVTVNVVSPTGVDTLALSPVSATGVWGNGTHFTPTDPATTTVTYTTRLSAGTYGVVFQPRRSDSSGSSIRFTGALAGNSGGVQPNSIVVVDVLRDALHVTVSRCSVVVPSDVGEIDLTFVVVRADSTQVC